VQETTSYLSTHEDASLCAQSAARSAYEQLGEILDNCVTAANQREFVQNQDNKPRDASRANLLHYLAFRTGDHRNLQKTLVSLGLSSLGRCEPSVLSSLQLVRHAAGRLVEPPRTGVETQTTGIPLARGRALLDQQTEALFGPRPHARVVRVMVTIPSEAAEKDGDAFMQSLLEKGMDAARINTAHDDPASWRRMIANIRAAELTLNRDPQRRCRIFLDLAGPKIRTAALRKNGRHSESVRLSPGDRCRLHTTDATTSSRPHRRKGTPKDPTQGVEIWIEHADVLSAVCTGHRVWFDDGKVGCRVVSVTDAWLEMEVTATKPGGQKLRLHRGLNLPDTPIDLPALTQADAEIVREFADEVDAYCLSFVSRPEDVRDLASHIVDSVSTSRHPALVVKIETQRGFERLPEILLALLEVESRGVMIARGDLAVELGFARLAEVQEEILWLCEAAHTPAIWATEVLASLAKRGLSARGEVTDAAMAQRAECVMLNKGPRILDAITELSDILARMEMHQRKKMSTLRPLRVAASNWIRIE
jgi:pyruvate kinase